MLLFLVNLRRPELQDYEKLVLKDTLCPKLEFFSTLVSSLVLFLFIPVPERKEEKETQSRIDSGEISEGWSGRRENNKIEE